MRLFLVPINIKTGSFKFTKLLQYGPV